MRFSNCLQHIRKNHKAKENYCVFSLEFNDKYNIYLREDIGKKMQALYRLPESYEQQNYMTIGIHKNINYF